MINTPMKSRTHLETRPGAVRHTDVAEMVILSVRGAKYFITSIEEASGQVTTCHMKSKGEAA